LHKLLFYVIINKKSSSAETRITFVILYLFKSIYNLAKMPPASFDDRVSVFRQAANAHLPHREVETLCEVTFSHIVRNVRAKCFHLFL